MQPEKIFFVGAGPGDPELLTLKGKAILEKADVILYAGSLVNPVILKYARPEAKCHDSAKMDLEEMVSLMVDAFRKGKLVARLHSGDPSLFGAINEQVEVLAAEGIDSEVIPGVSSFVAGAASLKRELTIPDVSQTVIVTRAEGRTKMPEGEKLLDLARHRAAMVLFLSGDLVEEVQEDLLKAYPPDTPIAIIHKASWPDEKVFQGCLEELTAIVRREKLELTTLIYVGSFLKASGKKSRLYDKTFSHRFRKAAQAGSSKT